MSLFKRIITLTLVLTMMTGCSFVNNAGAQKVFNFADSGYVTSLDASKAIDETSTNVIQAFGDGLYAYNVKSKLKPAIAKSMKVSDDGKTYTFEIRKNVKWSNGDPVTAEDFVYAWKRALSMRSDASKLLTSYGAAIAGADEIYNGRKSADTLGVYVKDKKLVVNLAYKTSRFMDLVTQPVFFPLNQKFVEAQGDQYATSPKTLLSCGTYKVSSISKDKITLKKNKTCYIAKKTNIDLVNMYFGISNEDKIKMFDEGKIDFAAVTGENAKKYDGKDSSTADSDSVIWDLVPNFKDQYLSDTRVREAMSLLLERKKYNKQVLHDGSHKAQGLLPMGICFNSNKQFIRDASRYKLKYDKKEAKKTLSKLLNEYKLKKFTFTLTYTNDYPATKAIAGKIKDDLEATKQIKVYLKEVNTVDYNQAELSLLRIKGVCNDAYDYLAPLAVNNQGINHYANNEFNNYFRTAVNAKDQDERYYAFLNAERVAMRDYAFIPVVHQGQRYVINVSVTGLICNFSGAPYSVRYMSMH